MNRLAVAIALCFSLTATSATASSRVPPPLLFGPPAEVELTQDEQARVDDFLDSLRDAEDAATEDPIEGLDELNRLLERIEGDPALAAKSVSLQQDRCFVALTVADTLIEDGDEDNATGLLDYVIRSSHTKDLPVSSYSKELRELYAERSAAPMLAREGSLNVQCQQPCRVVLDEQLVGAPDGARLDDLVVGDHRLYIEATDGSTDPVQELVTLSSNEPEYSIVFGEARRVDEDKPVKTRKLPRWAGVTGVVVGAALVIAGGTLLALDETCPDGSDPMGPDACDDVFDTLVTGAALTAAGGATLVGFSIALGIGEKRARRNGERTEARVAPSVSLGYTLRF